MPTIAYRSGWTPTAPSAALIDAANEVCRDFAGQGYGLTLRQLYYQLVTKNLIPNTEESYKRLGRLLVDARYHGMLNWSYLSDRTRNLSGGGHWDSPREIITTSADGYSIDHWEGQPRRVEVWVEKEALAEVVGRAARELDVSFLCCKGYISVSEMWSAGQRFERYQRAGLDVTILYLGDHDPSGMDMTRDIETRLREFTGDDDEDWLHVERIALNMEQIERYSPPSNPAKLTDPRGTGYVDRLGPVSWELDALRPQVLNDLITDSIRERLDTEIYAARLAEEESDRDGLRLICDNYDSVVDYVTREFGPTRDDDPE